MWDGIGHDSVIPNDKLLLLILIEATLALHVGHNVNTTRHLGHFFAVTFRALRLRFFVLGDGFGTLE